MNSSVRPLSSFSPVSVAERSCDFTFGLSALPRGSICEILGVGSSGRTAVAHSLLATATLGGEVAAVVDGSDAFDPSSARRAGADLGKVLWVQCGHRLETALRATDLILHSGGFGLVLLDLCDVPQSALGRVPGSYWHRFRLAVEHTPGILLVLSEGSVARSCAARQFSLRQQTIHWEGDAPFQTLHQLRMEASSRKPMASTPVLLEALALESLAEV